MCVKPVKDLVGVVVADTVVPVPSVKPAGPYCTFQLVAPPVVQFTVALLNRIFENVPLVGAVQPLVVKL